jgi:hypothetical protein
MAATKRKSDKKRDDERLLEAVAEAVRDRTRRVLLTRARDLRTEPPALAAADARPLLERLAKAGGDIAAIKGGKDTYYFSTGAMTAQYATLLVRVTERDLVRLVADTVRENARLYPRPTADQSFLAEPYGLSPSELERVYDELGRDRQYADIRRCRASNGAAYLYSDKHLTAEHARGLTEWEEVGRHENP